MEVFRVNYGYNRGSRPYDRSLDFDVRQRTSRVDKQTTQALSILWGDPYLFIGML